MSYRPGLILLSLSEFVGVLRVSGVTWLSMSAVAAIYRRLSQALRRYGVCIGSRKQLAMFLTHVMYQSCGLRRIKDPKSWDKRNVTCDPDLRNYFNRGYLPLAHRSMYQAASLELFNDMRLVENPDMLTEWDDVTWSVALWIWNRLVSSDYDTSRRVALGDFDATVEVIWSYEIDDVNGNDVTCEQSTCRQLFDEICRVLAA